MCNSDFILLLFPSYCPNLQGSRGAQRPQIVTAGLFHNAVAFPRGFLVFSKCFPSYCGFQSILGWMLPETIHDQRAGIASNGSFSTAGKEVDQSFVGPLVSPHCSVSQAQQMIPFFPSLLFAIVSIDTLRAE